MSCGSLYSLTLNPDFHSDQCQNSPSETQSPCYLLEFFGAFDPENFKEVLVDTQNLKATLILILHKDSKLGIHPFLNPFQLKELTAGQSSKTFLVHKFQSFFFLFFFPEKQIKNLHRVHNPCKQRESWTVAMRPE